MTSPKIVVYEDDVSMMSAKYPIGRDVPLTFVYVHDVGSDWKFEDVEQHLKRERFFHKETRVLDLLLRTMRDVNAHVPPQADVYFVDGLDQGKILFALLKKLPQSGTTINSLGDLSGFYDLEDYNKLSRAIETSDLEWIARVSQQVAETRTDTKQRRRKR